MLFRSAHPHHWKIHARVWPIYQFCRSTGNHDHIHTDKTFSPPCTQVYMVAGGWSGLANLASTETLLVEGGTAWVEAAALPSARRGLSGQGLGNRHFIVTGEAHLYSRAVNKPSRSFHNARRRPLLCTRAFSFLKCLLALSQESVM